MPIYGIAQRLKKPKEWIKPKNEGQKWRLKNEGIQKMKKRMMKCYVTYQRPREDLRETSHTKIFTVVRWTSLRMEHL
jgi:hypothetical protein